MRHIWVLVFLSFLVTNCAPASKVTQEDLDKVNSQLANKEEAMKGLQRENEELRKEIEILKRAVYGNDPQAIKEHQNEEMGRLKEQQQRLHVRIEQLQKQNQELKSKLQGGGGQRNSEKLPE